MNYNTRRIKEYNPQGSIKSQLFKHSAEYLVLAVLKHHIPLKYNKAVLLERPDIQLEGLGVEVTIADSRENMQTSIEFSKYCHGNNTELRKKTIEKSGKYKIKKVKNSTHEIAILQSGGGANNNYLSWIENAICKKEQNISKYINDYNGTLELAILQKERVPGVDYEQIADHIIRLSSDINTVHTVYYIDQKCMLCVDLISKETTQFDHGECYECLHKMARMTAEGIIALEDEEWA